MEEGATGHPQWVAAGSWEGSRLSLEPLEGMCAHTLSLAFGEPAFGLLSSSTVRE